MHFLILCVLFFSCEILPAISATVHVEIFPKADCLVYSVSFVSLCLVWLIHIYILSLNLNYLKCELLYQACN